MMFRRVVAVRFRQVLNGAEGLLHPIGVELGVHDLEVDHRVDLHGDVVLGDDGLGSEIDDLLLQAHPLGDTVQNGHLYMKPHAPSGVVAPQALHHKGTGLLDHMDVGHQQDNDDHCDGDEHKLHSGSSFFFHTHPPGSVRPAVLFSIPYRALHFHLSLSKKRQDYCGSYSRLPGSPLPFPAASAILRGEI